VIELKKLLEYQVHHGCSDLHFITGEPPLLREKNGKIQPIADAAVLTKEDVEKIVLKIIGETGLKTLSKKKEIDYAMEEPGLSRFRISFYEEIRGPAIAIRAIPFEIPKPKEIGIPPTILECALHTDGLILITGPNGSGKTTTLASLIDYINENREAHIITIEDPVEFIYHRKKSVISQRAVGIDTDSFSVAIKHAVRQDVDVIVIGEMRDLETISTAITLAETGHLVLATLHTDDAPRTVQRIVDVFPATQQQQIALQLSYSLLAVMSQRLLPKKDKTGRICVREIMLMTSGIRHAIRARKISEIYSQIQISRETGMQLFDDNLLEYVKKGIVSLEPALRVAHDPQQLHANLKSTLN